MNIHPDKNVHVISLGLMEYKKAWDYQEDLFRKTINIKLTNRDLPDKEKQLTPNYLLFCQHPNVYTIGKSGSESNLLLDEKGLGRKQAQYFKINRGGDITYHGPGQLVCYPIIDLDNFFEDIHQYLRYLEQAVIDTLDEFGIKGSRIQGLTGVWVSRDKSESDAVAPIPAKICAMGVKTSRWVTMHGLALNVNPELEYFDNIIPCGINDKAVTSMEKVLGQKVSIDNVEKALSGHLEKQFEMTLHY